MQPRMKKLNLRDLWVKSGKLTLPKPSRKARATAVASEDGDGDMSILSEQQREYVKARYTQVTNSNKHLEPNDDGYITQDDLRDEFNSEFGVNKSIRSYYRIWNEHEADY